MEKQVAKSFLTTLFAGLEGYIEFRGIKSGSTPKRLFISSLSEVPWEKLAAWEEQQYNIFVGCCTRLAPGLGKNEDVVATQVVWLDLDSQDDALIQQVCSCSPTLHICSGHGFHFYWKLSEPLRLGAAAYQGQRADFQSVLRGICHHIGIGTETTDFARVMRVPGTTNWKDVPLPCYVVNGDGDAHYSLAQLAEMFGAVEQLSEYTEQPAGEIEAAEPFDPNDYPIPHHTLDLVINGWPGGDSEARYPSRSEADMAVINQLWLSGLSPEQIKRLFLDYPIGEKYREPRHGDRYLQLALAKAKDWAKAPSQALTLRDGVYWKSKVVKKQVIEEQVSNFHIEPLSRLRLPSEEVIHGLLHSAHPHEGERPREVFLRRRDLLGWRDLLRALPLPGAQWLGSDHDVQLLAPLLAHSQVPFKIGVPAIGWTPDLSSFVHPKGELNPTGPVTPPEHIYVPQHIDLEQHLCAHLSESNITVPVLEQLPVLHEPATVWPIAAWYLMAPAALAIRKKLGHFPLLMVWGSQGGGKTCLLSAFSHLLGVDTELRTCTRTLYPVIRELALTNCYPITLDEYRPREIAPSRLGALHNLLRAAYNGETESRGRADPYRPVDEFRLQAPVAVAGEVPFTDPALVERSLLVVVDRNYVPSHPTAQSAMAQMQALPLPDFFGNYLLWLWRQPVVGWVEDALHVVRERYVQVPLRMQDAFAVMIAGMRCCAALADEHGVAIDVPDPLPVIDELRVRSIPQQRPDGRPETMLDHWMHTLVVLVHAGELIEGRDYLVAEAEGKLYLYTQYAYDKTLEWRKQHAYLDTDPLHDTSLQRQMMENQAAGGYIEEIQARKRLPHGNRRCAVIDLRKVEAELGIAEDAWSMWGGAEMPKVDDV